jgi:dolichol-phosphate mannosyltransferase
LKVVTVLPTYNERANIEPLIEALQAAGDQTRHHCEILVVDDNSPDGTGDVVRALQQRYGNLHLLSGTKQGLGVAYARGIDHALRQMHADVIVHMDADFSHDPADLPRLVAKIDEGYDVVVGTRYMEGGALPGDWGWRRRLISRLANFGARIIAGLTALHDCTNGYRAYRASVLLPVDLSSAPRGYAVLTFLAYHGLMNGGAVAEVPIVFSQRAQGTSKLRLADVIEFFLNVWWIRYDRRERFLRYASGGLSSVAANLATIALLYYVAGVPALAASALAIEASVLFSIGWRRVWGRALGRRQGNLGAFALRSHVLAIPPSLLTFGVFAILTRAGVAAIAGQSAGILPALIWNYFIGDRGLDILRRLNVLHGMSAIEPATRDRTPDGLH